MELRSHRTLSLWLLLLVLPGCAGLPARVESRASPCTARGFILVADGAGGYQTAPRAVANAIDELGLPMHVSSFDWTHGRGRILADVLDTDNLQCQGVLLA